MTAGATAREGRLLTPAESREAGARLQAERQAAGLSRARLGAWLGRSGDWVRIREAGSFRMTDTEAEALLALTAEALRKAAGDGGPRARLAVAVLRERTSRGWTQAALAARAGVSVATVWKVEKQLQGASVDVAARIAEALGLRLGAVLDGTAAAVTACAKVPLEETASLLAADLRAAREPQETVLDLALKLAGLGWVKGGRRA